MQRLEKLAGYSVLGALGKGGMGVVYIGFDDKQNRLAALKVLSDQISPDPVAVQRFKREADLYRQISHPNVVEMYDTGQFQGTHFIALELVQGRPLNDILAEGGGQRPVLSVVQSIEVFRSLLSALQTCHGLGVVHRDLKPHNVIINPFGITKLLDFGVAQVTDDDMNLTKTGLIIGTLVYASPEQNQGKAVDGRSDLYSLGLMLYEFLTGRRLFRGSNVGEIILQQIQTVKATISDKVPGMPPQFDAYFAKLLHPMVTSRWESAREAFSALDALVQSLGTEGRRFFYGEPLDELWFASRIHFVRREYQQSEDLARKLLAAGRNTDPAVHLLLGRVAREKKDQQQTIQCFTQVLQLAPGDLAARLEYVLALNTFGLQELAMKEIDGILKLDPTNTYAQGLQALFSHQVKWMSREEVEARRRVVLDEPATTAPEPETQQPVGDSDFVDKVVAAMRAEGRRYVPSEVAEAAWYPGAGQFAVGRKQEGALFALTTVVLLVILGWAAKLVVLGGTMRIPVNDVIVRFYSEASMVEAIESGLEDRVNDSINGNLALLAALVGGAAALGLYGLLTVSASRAVTFARGKALVCQVIVVDGDNLHVDVGADLGAAVGNRFQVLKISRKGKLPIGSVELTKVEAQSSVGRFIAAVKAQVVDPDTEPGDDVRAADDGGDVPPPAVGDILVPLRV